jgi:hypothetical protein
MNGGIVAHRHESLRDFAVAATKIPVGLEAALDASPNGNSSGEEGDADADINDASPNQQDAPKH